VNRPGTSQRVAMHYASATDVAEAYMAGAAAVKAAMAGTSGKMITLVRENKGGKYACSTGTVNLRDIANAEKLLPREFINAQGNGMTEAFCDYARPLIQGQAELDVASDGLPVYTRFARHMVEKKTLRQYAV
jgi:6-phosphofructokinase 1